MSSSDKFPQNIILLYLLALGSQEKGQISNLLCYPLPFANPSCYQDYEEIHQ
jgi:hypothetical protein